VKSEVVAQSDVKQREKFSHTNLPSNTPQTVQFAIPFSEENVMVKRETISD
jgi:hypothetical protein